MRMVHSSMLPSKLHLGKFRGAAKWQGCDSAFRWSQRIWDSFKTNILRRDAGQNAPPGGNSRHTLCKTPQKVVTAFVPLVLHILFFISDRLTALKRLKKNPPSVKSTERGLTHGHFDTESVPDPYII